MPDALDLFDQFFSSDIPGLDREALRKEYLSLHSPYIITSRRLPEPVWRRRGYTETGPAAWGKLQTILPSIEPERAFCIYVHIPFCADKCHFCDCYAFPLRRQVTSHIQAYSAHLEGEIRLWGSQPALACRPVSTVHFGGGTPLFLGAAAFRRLVEQIRSTFHTVPSTEWALETTSSELTEEMFQVLDSLGFNRLHLGVQTLDDPIRRLINRREPAGAVLEKISRSVERGWITSVDLIFGLPRQSLASFLNDIRLVAKAGGNGYSLYELQHSSHNRPFIERAGLADRDRTFDYFLLQAGTQLLNTLGYTKNLFNHFADEEDSDLYFTFPERGEDCLALGTIADGVFSGYHYRHPEYATYSRNVSSSFPGLEGGVKEDPRPGLSVLESSILSARLAKSLFTESLGIGRAETLFTAWLEAALIAPDVETPDLYRLTANGSWFTGEMMAQMAAA
jgi:coproporphyrinogen III oxidase-like Fe-S oxidoreductase